MLIGCDVILEAGRAERAKHSLWDVMGSKGQQREEVMRGNKVTHVYSKIIGL